MSLELNDRRLQRQDSFSTVSSSVAAEIIRQSSAQALEERRFEESFNTAQSNVKIDGSKAIQVGDIIYNFYTPPARESERILNLIKVLLQVNYL